VVAAVVVVAAVNLLVCFLCPEVKHIFSKKRRSNGNETNLLCVVVVVVV
jgi:hypothetical protein